MRLNLNNVNTNKEHLLTSQRKLLLELLQEADRHIDAKELYRRASARDQSISPATVYRSINLFKQFSVCRGLPIEEHGLLLLDFFLFYEVLKCIVKVHIAYLFQLGFTPEGYPD